MATTFIKPGDCARVAVPGAGERLSAIGDAITATVNEATEGLRSGSSKASGDDETTDG